MGTFFSGLLIFLAVIAWFGGGYLGARMMYKRMGLIRGETANYESLIFGLVLLAFIGGFLVPLFSYMQPRTKTCPYCKNSIPPKATVCGFCRRDVE